MDICLLGSKEYPPFHTSRAVGGIERYISTIAKELTRRGINVKIITRQLGNQKFYERKRNLQIYRIPYIPGKYTRTPSFNLFSIYYFGKILKRGNIDIIHATACWAGFASYLIKKIWGFEYILTMQTVDSLKPEWSKVRPLFKIVEKCSIENAQHIIAVSEEVCNEIIDTYNISRARMQVIPNGIDISVYKCARRQILKKDKKNILFVGTLRESKGVRFLLDAVKLLDHNYHLHITGDGPQRVFLEKHAETLQINDKVTFLGARNDIPDLMKSADVFVISSLTEGLPFVILEAMASEIPIVATNVGGMKDILKNNYSGLLVKPANPQELKNGIEKIVCDPNLAKKLTINAANEVKKKYSIEKVVDTLINVYEHYI
jgi:glycosyltransferase involved in cell wall biosynthesis